MLKGCVPWPEEFARRYIEAGLWEGITVAEMVERTARRQPQKVAVVHGETRTTYDELVRSAKRLAGGLANLGLQPQDRVVVQLPNGVGVRLAVSRTELHRRDPGDGAARPSTRRDSPLHPIIGSGRLLHCRSRGLVRLPSDGCRHGRRVPHAPPRRRRRRTGAESDRVPHAVGERPGRRPPPRRNVDPILRTCRRCCSRAERRRCRS